MVFAINLFFDGPIEYIWYKEIIYRKILLYNAFDWLPLQYYTDGFHNKW